eukprot:Gb_40870 [translate_table: standard]
MAAESTLVAACRFKVSPMSKSRHEWVCGSEDRSLFSGASGAPPPSVFHAKRSPNKISCQCHVKAEKITRQRRGLLRRRQMLMASTSTLRMPAQLMGQHLITAEQHTMPPSDLTNFQKVLDSKQLKNRERWADSLGPKPPLNSPHDFTGLVVPQAALADEEKVKSGRSVEAPLKRPPKKDEGEYEVAIQGIEVRRDRPFWFDVYISSSSNGTGTSERRMREYAGTFANLPRPKQGHQMKLLDDDKAAERTYFSCLRLGIGDILDRLGIEEEESFIVTLMPNLQVNQDHPIKVASINIH